jgi:hypothetical protein
MIEGSGSGVDPDPYLLLMDLYPVKIESDNVKINKIHITKEESSVGNVVGPRVFFSNLVYVFRMRSQLQTLRGKSRLIRMITSIKKMKRSCPPGTPLVS